MGTTTLTWVGEALELAIATADVGTAETEADTDALATAETGTDEEAGSVVTSAAAVEIPVAATAED